MMIQPTVIFCINTFHKDCLSHGIQDKTGIPCEIQLIDNLKHLFGARSILFSHIIL